MQVIKYNNDVKPIVGENAYAIGNPFGQDHTFTSGIISANNREITAPTGRKIYNVIQTDAAINGGNSGGALIDISSGVVVGINSFGATDAEGLNFALPSYTACKVLELYKNKKDPSPLDFQVFFSNNKEQGKFLRISEVLNKQSLLKVGDEILEVDNKKVENPTQLSNEARGKSNITVKILRDNKQQELKLQLKSRGSVTERVGLIFSNIVIGDKSSSTSGAINQKMNNPDTNLVVQNLRSGPGSGKLRKFDVINYIDGKEFKTAQSLHDYLKDKKEIEVFFRRPSLNEERKITFTNFHEKIEVKDVKKLRFE